MPSLKLPEFKPPKFKIPSFKLKLPKLKLPKFKLKLPDLSDPKQKFAVIVYSCVAVVMVLFITAVAVPVFSNPVFCGYSCHENTPQYIAWQRSSHAKVPCYACHSEPGLVNLLKDKIFIGLPTVFNKFAGHEWPVNADSETSLEMPTEVCERCHNMDNRVLTPSKGIIMNHEAHKKKGVRCPICHNRVAHLAVNNQDPNGVSYDAGERNDHRYLSGLTMSEGCFRCHTRKETKLREEVPEWRTAPTACTTCHNSEFQLPPGHGPTWRTDHRFVVKSNGKEFCFRCHNDEFCSQCHDLDSIRNLLD